MTRNPLPGMHSSSPAPGRHLGRRDCPTQWEVELERAWRRTPDQGPGFWKVGFWLSHGFLSALLTRQPWRHQPWAKDS